MTLRAYIQNILSYPYYLNSPILRSFLLSNPTTLTPPEAADCQRRLEADAVREEGRKRFREEAERRVEALREGLAQFKGDVLSQDGGLQKVFEVVRKVERVENLPKAESSVLEWGRISCVKISHPGARADLQTCCNHLPGLCGFGYCFGNPDIAEAASWLDAVLRAQGNLEDIQPDGDDSR
jgi:hypothetical protein